MFNQEDTVNFYREGSIRFRDLRQMDTYIPAFQALTFIRTKNDYHHMVHRHDFYEIIIPDDDRYRCMLNKREVSVSRNELLLLQYGDLHEDILCRGSQFAAITFDLKTHGPVLQTARMFRAGLAPSDQKITVAAEDPIRSLLRLMRDESSQNSPTTYNVLNGLFHAVFWLFVRAFPPAVFVAEFGKSANRDVFRNDLLNLFEENLYGKVQLDELARRMKVSESSLSHKCRDVFGLPPAKAFLQYKFKKAETYVRHSQLTINEISDLFGFENQFHFSRLFKKIYGMSPSRYRIHKQEYP